MAEQGVRLVVVDGCDLAASQTKGDRGQGHVLGDVAGLGWLMNIRYATGGGDHTLMRGRTAGTGPMPFANVHGAAYRGVYDMADPDSSVFVISTGQSGHPFSRFYDNLGERWRRGEYIPMSLDPALADAGSAGVMMLMPGAQPVQ